MLLSLSETAFTWLQNKFERDWKFVRNPETPEAPRIYALLESRYYGGLGAPVVSTVFSCDNSPRALVRSPVICK